MRRRRQQACEATPAGGAYKCTFGCSSTASLMLTGSMKPADWTAETPEPLERHDGDNVRQNLTTWNKIMLQKMETSEIIFQIL